MPSYQRSFKWFVPSAKFLSSRLGTDGSYPRFFSLGCKNSVQDNSGKRKTDEETRILKIAIIGTPNSGKSTLINQIAGRNIFAVSRKVHTTRCCAKAVLTKANAQIVFLDTPGLVSLAESTKHKLEESFLLDSEEAVREADVIGVIHDVANKFTRERLDSKVLRLLYLYPRKHSFLILNKVDAVKLKGDLLQLTRTLTNSKISNDLITEKMTQSEFQETLNMEVGWPHFSDIFMVSALHGDGVGDIKLYLLDLARPGKWLFEETAITDQDEVKLIENIVFSKLLEYLPNVVPYNLKVALEYFNKSQDGSVTAIVLVGCANIRMQKFVMGKGGGRMKKIALGVEQDLRKFFLNDVRVKLVLVNAKELEQPIPMDPELLRDLISKRD